MFSTISSNLKSPNSASVGIPARPIPQEKMDSFVAYLNSQKAQSQLREYLRINMSYSAGKEKMPEGEGGWCV